MADLTVAVDGANVPVYLAPAPDAVLDAAALAALALKVSTADLASTAAGKGSALAGYASTVPADPEARTLLSKASDIADLRDWNGLDLTGANDMTSLLTTAADEVSQGRLFLPNGTILVGNLPILGAAGLQLIGESKWKTKLKVGAGTTGSILYNDSGSGSSLIRIANMIIDLNGEDVDAIDFNNIGNSLIEHVYVKGGANKAGAAGRGIVFQSSLGSSSYTNAAFNCKVENLTAGIAWDSGGNENAVFNCEAINCTVGYDALPATGTVDTPTIHGGRAEGCDIGVRDGAVGLGAFGVRFESSSTADVEFHTGSERSIYLGCYTASSTAVLKDEANATGLFCMGGRFPVKVNEPSTSRPMFFTGRKVFAAAGSTGSAPSITSSAAYFQDYPLLANSVALEFVNAAGDNRIIGISGDSNDNLVISGFRRKDSSNGDVILGRGVVRPNSSAAQDLGTASVQWRNLRLSGGAFVGSNQVLGSRKTGWTAATGTATRTGFTTSTATTQNVAEALKALIDDLISHGIIGA